MIQFGTVESFDPARQTGIIISEQGNRPIRIDRRAVAEAGLGQVAVGQRLGFNLACDRQGPHATGLWATWSGR